MKNESLDSQLPWPELSSIGNFSFEDEIDLQLKLHRQAWLIELHDQHIALLKRGLVTQKEFNFLKRIVFAAYKKL